MGGKEGIAVVRVTKRPIKLVRFLLCLSERYFTIVGRRQVGAKQVPVVACFPGPISVSSCRRTQQRFLT